MRKLVISALLGLITLCGCNRNLSDSNESRTAYQPIYGERANYIEVKSEPAKALKNGGKIVLYGKVLYQVEAGEGIHVFDVTNAAAPKRLGFIKSFMCQELAIKDGHIITNNMDDLVVINAANPANVSVVNRIAGEFPDMVQAVPPEAGAYFECPEPQKGLVIGWTKTTSKNAKCKRN